MNHDFRSYAVWTRRLRAEVCSLRMDGATVGEKCPEQMKFLNELADWLDNGAPGALLSERELVVPFMRGLLGRNRMDRGETFEGKSDYHVRGALLALLHLADRDSMRVDGPALPPRQEYSEYEQLERDRWKRTLRGENDGPGSTSTARLER